MIRKSGWLVVAVAAVALAGCKEKVGGEAEKATAAATTGEKVKFTITLTGGAPAIRRRIPSAGGGASGGLTWYPPV